MKIALFHNLGSGGAKRALHEHARHLHARGHDLDLYTTTAADETFLSLAPYCGKSRVYSFSFPNSPSASELVNHSILSKLRARVAALKTLRHHRLTWSRLETLYQEMAEEIDAGGYDLAYVHHCRFLLSPALLRFLKTPTVYYCQDTLRAAHEWSNEEHPEYDSLNESPFRRKVRGSIMTPLRESLIHEQDRRNTENARAAGCVLSNSLFSREAIWRTMGIVARCCRLGVDSDFYRPSASRRGEFVLSAGSLTAAKRHEFIIDSVRSIPAPERPQVRVVGNFPSADRGAVTAWCDRLTLHAHSKGVSVEILCDVSDEIMREQYQSAGVVALAPALEPFGLVALEAMACEAPVVAVAEGGLRESICDGETGILTERDTVQFGEAISRVLRDRDLAGRLGCRGREEVTARWSWQQSVDHMERVFESILKKEPTVTASGAAPQEAVHR